MSTQVADFDWLLSEISGDKRAHKDPNPNILSQIEPDALVKILDEEAKKAYAGQDPDMKEAARHHVMDDLAHTGALSYLTAGQLNAMGNYYSSLAQSYNFYKHPEMLLNNHSIDKMNGNAQKDLLATSYYPLGGHTTSVGDLFDPKKTTYNYDPSHETLNERARMRTELNKDPASKIPDYHWMMSEFLGNPASGKEMNPSAIGEMDADKFVSVLNREVEKRYAGKDPILIEAARQHVVDDMGKVGALAFVNSNQLDRLNDYYPALAKSFDANKEPSAQELSLSAIAQMTPAAHDAFLKITFHQQGSNANTVDELIHSLHTATPITPPANSTSNNSSTNSNGPSVRTNNGPKANINNPQVRAWGGAYGIDYNGHNYPIGGGGVGIGGGGGIGIGGGGGVGGGAYLGPNGYNYGFGAGYNYGYSVGLPQIYLPPQIYVSTGSTGYAPMGPDYNYSYRYSSGPNIGGYSYHGWDNYYGGYHAGAGIGTSGVGVDVYPGLAGQIFHHGKGQNGSGNGQGDPSNDPLNDKNFTRSLKNMDHMSPETSVQTQAAMGAEIDGAEQNGTLSSADAKKKRDQITEHAKVATVRADENMLNFIKSFDSEAYKDIKTVDDLHKVQGDYEKAMSQFYTDQAKDPSITKPTLTKTEQNYKHAMKTYSTYYDLKTAYGTQEFGDISKKDIDRFEKNSEKTAEYLKHLHSGKDLKQGETKLSDDNYFLALEQVNLRMKFAIEIANNPKIGVSGFKGDDHYTAQLEALNGLVGRKQFDLKNPQDIKTKHMPNFIQDFDKLQEKYIKDPNKRAPEPLGMINTSSDVKLAETGDKTPQALGSYWSRQAAEIVDRSNVVQFKRSVDKDHA